MSDMNRVPLNDEKLTAVAAGSGSWAEYSKYLNVTCPNCKYSITPQTRTPEIEIHSLVEKGWETQVSYYCMKCNCKWEISVR